MRKKGYMKVRGRNLMLKLFEPGCIGKVTIKNRIVMSPIGPEFWGCNGEVKDQLIITMKPLQKEVPGLLCCLLSQLITLGDMGCLDLFNPALYFRPSHP
jgi:hypothetical protein